MSEWKRLSEETPKAYLPVIIKSQGGETKAEWDGNHFLIGGFMGVYVQCEKANWQWRYSDE